ncbi:unnamed protein product [Durusdinium trenchii]|uniref:N-acetylgalactosaminide beta-1,3-galactosyltransferase n=1 Tax=Durusdinium trenchii TaxID=1381693 RepID=A0ABP0N6F4_9DINO
MDSTNPESIFSCLLPEKNHCSPRVLPGELCLFVGSSQWESIIEATWASHFTTFLWPDAVGVQAEASNCTNKLPRLSLEAVPGVSADQPHFQALSLWSTLARRLLTPNVSRSEDPLSQCYWLMHVDGRSYINIPRIAERLDCVAGLQPEYYALSAMIGESRVGLADESTGYVFGRKLLFHLHSSGWVEKCAREFSNSEDAQGFGWTWPSGFYVSLCLWWHQRLRSQRLGDPLQEVLTRSLPRGRDSPLHRLRSLHPSGHCILCAAASSPSSLREIHRRVQIASPGEKDVARDSLRAEVGCFVHSLAEPEALAPPWSYRVARAIARCPLKLALGQQPEIGVSILKQELLRPSLPKGAAAAYLRGRRKELCILMPATDATPTQVDRAVAAVETWARRYLPSAGRVTGRTLALLYSRHPLLETWKDFTLSLHGDLDMRHPKFNALRFVYMWLTLATHLATYCDFWMKADMDAYVNIPRIRQALRFMNASEKIYAGAVTFSHGPGYETWNTFAHGIGYIISRAALRAAVPGLRKCMDQLLQFRLEAIEDMLLGACLRKVEIYPRELGHMIYNYRSGQVQRVLEEKPLVTHRVDEDEMYRLHTAVADEPKMVELSPEEKKMRHCEDLLEPAMCIRLLCFSNKLLWMSSSFRP